MPNQSLTDLPERTTTSGSDRIHVNNAGTDYQQTKDDFLQGSLYVAFSNGSTITSQVDALAEGSYFGKLPSANQTTTGTPASTSYYVEVQVASANYASIRLTTYGSNGLSYYKHKVSGTWASSWTQVPDRDEITALNNSLTNSLFVDTNNKTSYSFPVSPPNGSFGYFLLFGGTTSADTSNVFLFVGMVANGNVQFVRLCGSQNFTGTISNGVCTITSTNTVWGGIRVISIN